MALLTWGLGTGAAEPAQPRSTELERPLPSFSLQFHSIAGGASVVLDKGNAPVLDYRAAVYGAGVRWSAVVRSSFEFGPMMSVLRYSRVGQVRVHDARTVAEEWYFETSHTIWAPLGAFLEWYPVSDAGFFFGVSGSVGYIPPSSHPAYDRLDSTIFMAGYSLDVGYAPSRWEEVGLGVFLRYSGWTGAESPLHSDFPQGTTSRALLLGALVTFGPTQR
jgi:hypothetical protein